MNESDPIVAEVRRIRDEHAAKFGYDPKAIFEDIKELERRSGRTYVSFADEGGLTATAETPNQKLPVEPSKKMSFPEFGMTDEELERQDNDPNERWYTADEVMARLRQLRKEPN